MVLLLQWTVLFLVPAVAHSQSGAGGDEEEDEEDDAETAHCSSDLIIHDSSLTCLLSEDFVKDKHHVGVQLCFTQSEAHGKKSCLKKPLWRGNSFTFQKLDVGQRYNLTVHKKGRRTLMQSLALQDIVKVRVPWIENVTFFQASNRALLYIGCPYPPEKEYLTTKMLLFQVRIRNNTSDLTRDVPFQPVLIEEGYLGKSSRYMADIRARPKDFFNAGWSDWSPAVNFTTYTGTRKVSSPEEDAGQMMAFAIAVVLLIVLLVATVMVLRWRKEILSTLWPSIPHPKSTLVQMNRPGKKAPMSFHPEVFSNLYVSLGPREKEPGTGADPLDGDDSAEGTSCSDSSDPSASPGGSASTCLRSEAQGERLSLGSTGSSVGVLEDAEVTGSGDVDGSEPTGACNGGSKDEAYVTMSSFYQTK